MLLQELEQIVQHYVIEVEMIRSFTGEMNNLLTRKLQKIKPPTLSRRDMTELRAFIRFLNSAISHKPKSTHTFTIKSKKLSKLVMTGHIPFKYQHFLSEMTLSYLICFQEAFIKQYLYTVLVSRRSLLKSKKQITYEEICGFRSIKKLVSHIARNEVDTLGYASVDDTTEYFKQRFNIALEECAKWQILREASYRRNIIIHNDGITNDIYCPKTGYKRRNVHLNTEVDYIRKVIQALLEFIIFFHDKMTRKLSLVK